VSSWDATYRRLRAGYVQNAAGRFERMANALTALEFDPSDAPAVESLQREFHGLAGSGRIYGFGCVSDLGRAAERDVAEAIARPIELSRGDIERWRRALDLIRAEFDSTAESE
jgi:chemotaxis protein histidine kinase CheA